MAKRTRKPNKAKLKFEHRLVLANWMLDLFGVATFEDLAKHMRDPAFKGFNPVYRQRTIDGTRCRLFWWGVS